ncbi:DUF302 domain-containing protein [Leucothrix arctica]|uniref:DUF302 domain-containing protein n=1 Tax=Leucothrix arctica TaxID=1481894 RepID=A0A317C4P5_9GAMM|nr:DUF302 domain-containing protein [Leucothrix arctica]PWQ93171.1 hypothetical protein DKT75_21010 [Leucothrix arctica]
MKKNLLCTLLLAAVPLTAAFAGTSDKAEKSDNAEKTTVVIPSVFSVKDTADKLSAILKSKGLTEFARINHAENAEKAGMKLRPTELMIFGNPKVGTPLMLCAQTVAIDLPQKMLIWQDEADKVWLSYNTPDYLKKRHSIEGCDEVLGKITNVLGALSKAATSK